MLYKGLMSLVLWSDSLRADVDSVVMLADHELMSPNHRCEKSGNYYIAVIPSWLAGSLTAILSAVSLPFSRRNIQAMQRSGSFRPWLFLFIKKVSSRKTTKCTMKHFGAKNSYRFDSLLQIDYAWCRNSLLLHNFTTIHWLDVDSHFSVRLFYASN